MVPHPPVGVDHGQRSEVVRGRLLRRDPGLQLGHAVALGLDRRALVLEAGDGQRVQPVVGQGRVQPVQSQVVVAAAARDLRQALQRLGVAGIEFQGRFQGLLGARQQPHLELDPAQGRAMVRRAWLELDRLLDRRDRLVV